MEDKKDSINFIKGDYKDKYIFIKVLNEENFNIIHLIQSKISGEYRTLNSIPKSRFKCSKNFKEDIKKLSEIDNQKIINIIEVYMSISNFSIITEYCHGKSLDYRLRSSLNKNKVFSEKKGAYILKQIIQALKYAHTNKIIHGDIRLKNILFTSDDEENCEIKIVNFGMLNNYKTEFIDLKNKFELNYYQSPESLYGETNEYSDIWSAGVLLYVILTGQSPFVSDVEGDEKIIYKKIKNIDYQFNNKNGILISENSRDLISKMICPLNIRLNFDEVLKHPFLKDVNFYDNQNEHLDIKIPKESFIDNLIEFNNSNFIQKNLYKILVHRFSFNEIKDLNEMFLIFDRNNDGIISFNEFSKGMKCIFPYYNDDEIKKFFEIMDFNKSKKINYSEFVSASVNKKIFDCKEKIMEVFDYADTSHNGKISYKEFHRFLGQNSGDINEFKDDFRKWDTNKDGFIDRGEFMLILKNKRKSIISNDKNFKKNDLDCCKDCLII
jgi:calcium-dependent protein kinase